MRSVTHALARVLSEALRVVVLESRERRPNYAMFSCQDANHAKTSAEEPTTNPTHRQKLEILVPKNRCQGLACAYRLLQM
jgi:hypothetical protein